MREGHWLNEPARWRIDDDRLTLATDDRTDFWRETLYGFTRDNGHFLSFKTGSSFTAQVRVRGRFEQLYDQAGLMVRIDERRWIKAGIEFADGQSMIGSVLTNEASDWATSPYGGDPTDFWLRATVADGVIRIQVSADGITWPLVRLAPFPIAASYSVGPMACTPERAGLSVGFSDLRITAPFRKDLHDLT